MQYSILCKIKNIINAIISIASLKKMAYFHIKILVIILERNWNMWVPGFGPGELKPFKKSATTEAHRQVGYY